METILKLAVLCVTGAVFAALLKKTSPVMSLLLIAAICIASLAWMASLIEPLQTLWAQAESIAGLQAQLFVPVIKTLGIAILCRLSAQVCNDAEYSAAAALVEMAGAFAAILVSIPLWEAVWDMLQELL